MVDGGTVNPSAIERAGPEKPLPKDARASSLPDKAILTEGRALATIGRIETKG